MPPKLSTADDLIIALRDPRVMDALAGIFEAKLQPLIESVTQLKIDNELKSKQIAKLQGDLQSASARIESLESYTRRDNLLITGLPMESYAEATATNAESEPSLATEQAVLKLFNEQLGVQISSADISIAHRLKKRHSTNTRSVDTRPPVTIVRFTTRKAREAVYNARRQLKGNSTPIFINEDLSKSTAELFHQARQLVRAKVLHSTWTSSCMVYIRDTGEPSCRPRKIMSLGELPRASN